MNLILWLAVGGAIGWLASRVLDSGLRQGLLESVLIGIVGAFLGGWLLGPLLGVGNINQDDFSLRSLMLSLAGAVILLAVLRTLRRAFDS